MSKSEPITLSMALGIHASAIAAVGAIDVSLNCDTNLFIDPLLLDEATDRNLRDCATAAYRERFEQLIGLLAASKKVEDVAWRAARRQLSFHEIPYTHLGYSSGTSGSGFCVHLSNNLLGTAKEVVEFGVTDPDLFLALALLEDGVGADRISDMTTNIILPCLAQFSLQICDHLGLPRKVFTINGERYQLMPNPLKESEPILFVPKDIVRDLPIASDWDSVGSAAQQTQTIRDNVNVQIGEIWRAKTKKDKEAIRTNALRGKASFETLIELLRMAAGEPYDLSGDHRGEIYPADLRRAIANSAPLDLSRFSKRALTAEEANAVVVEIINKYKSLIENNGLWKELWNDAKTVPRLEKAMQRLFFAVASAYCEANNLDLSPEADAGCGPVDFKMSSGASAKVVVELKRSRNPKLVDGYTKQLETYKVAEGSYFGHYVVIDIGSLTSLKVSALTKAKNDALGLHGRASEITYIDGSVQESASKR